MISKTEELESSLRGVLEEVLETMFFSTAEPVNCAHDCLAIAAQVHFTGEPSGDFELRLSRSLARQFASAFLAVDDPDLPESAEADVACELANMICGAALSRVHPDAAVKLGAPRLADVAAPLDGSHQCFETPEGVLSITMRVL